MKKISQIKRVGCAAVTSYLNDGWSLYGGPQIPVGAYYPYQCMVKYFDTDNDERVVEYKLLEARESRYIDRECIQPNIGEIAEKYIKLGYQPYGPIIEVVEKTLTEKHIYQYLAMVKYE